VFSAEKRGGRSRGGCGELPARLTELPARVRWLPAGVWWLPAGVWWRSGAGVVAFLRGCGSFLRGVGELPARATGRCAPGGSDRVRGARASSQRGAGPGRARGSISSARRERRPTFALRRSSVESPAAGRAGERFVRGERTAAWSVTTVAVSVRRTRTSSAPDAHVETAVAAAICVATGVYKSTFVEAVWIVTTSA
jgi:hypothetical protein